MSYPAQGIELAHQQQGALSRCARDAGIVICPDMQIVREMVTFMGKCLAQTPECENREGNPGEVHVSSSPLNIRLGM
ncbi:hypothetical protein P7K49_030586 [Saguinus oedipus]|uniref:Uncharacterized protein n=1 Tax=Saguinus oedipus TaxID=9490 RepID=A0ABQ9U2K5_SAGOE|nr:hypothetical protein P7K49_030586 [Saguinus oedipus]